MTESAASVVGRSIGESRARYKAVTGSRKRSVILEILVRFYCRYFLRRPGLTKRVLFYIPDWKTLYETGMNEIFYLFKRESGYRVTCAVVELSSRCNLDCTICARFSVMKREQGHMTFETFKALVDNNPDVRIYILVGWGEMMMNKIFWEALEYLKARGKRVALTTNATLFNAKNVERLVNSGIDHITVSMDGMGEVFEAIRGVSYSKIEKNLLRLSNKIRETNSDIYLEINAAGTPEVVAQAPTMRERLGAHVDDIRFSSYVEYNKELKTNRTKPCREFWRGMITVWSDGSVVPCCMDYNTTMKMGDVAVNSLQDLWNNETNKGFRREHMRGEFKRRCETCYEVVDKNAGEGIANRFVG